MGVWMALVHWLVDWQWIMSSGITLRMGVFSQVVPGLSKKRGVLRVVLQISENESSLCVSEHMTAGRGWAWCIG